MMRLNALKHRLISRFGPTGRARVAPCVDSFGTQEEGGMTIIALFVFILMLTMGGISIDVMRHEMERAHLQAVLDSAVLAGAGAPADATEAEIREIVADFAAKSGKGDYLNAMGDDDVFNTVNSRQVQATADVKLNTYLMKLMGVPTLTAASASAAFVKVPKVEIVLALDVSGSMAGAKMDNLKVAAKEFVSTVVGRSDPGTVTISIVPYSWGVTPSDGMYEALNVRESHKYSTCIAFEDTDFAVTAINTTTSYKQRIYTSGQWVQGLFDNHANGLLSDPYSPVYNRTCFTDDYFRILPHATSEAILHAKIDSLQAAGSTSSHLGIKWAAGLLDPAFRTLMPTLQSSRQVMMDDGTPIFVTEVDPTLTNLPALYDEPDTKKIVILMGDGQNDSTFVLPDPNGLMRRATPDRHTSFDYRGPESYLHKIEYNNEVFQYAFDIYDPTRVWTDPGMESQCTLNWVECVYESATITAYYIYNPATLLYYPIDGGSSLSSSGFNNLMTMTNFVAHEHLDWEIAWGMISPYYIGWLTGNWSPWYAYRGGERTTATKDILMASSCTATKANGVIVYTIGFEVTEGGNAETQLRACASEASHYYRAEGVNITDAFSSIASNIQALRLTQ